MKNVLQFRKGFINLTTDLSESNEKYAMSVNSELMQFGFLGWEGVDYNWEDTMAYTDTFASSQQDESSGKWEDLG